MKHSFVKYLVFFSIMLTNMIALAQTNTITGTVKDNAGMPIPGATVLIKNTTSGVQTDFDGKFAIKAKPDDILVASFIGMKTTEVKVGNPYLYPSQNYNADLKWEYFLKNDELISVTAFGKYIIDPINEITLASSTNDISFINTGDSGHVYGIELEVRKNIFEIEGDLTNKLSTGFNASYMKTDQELDSEKVRNETDYNINLTNERAGFTGASDFLLNADLSYTKDFQNNKSVPPSLYL